LTELTTLEEKLSVTFRDKTKLVTALVHSSYVNENPGYTSNERLEFLGDAVLGLVIAEKLYEGLTRAGEGELTRKRAVLISRESLAHVARRIGLGDFLLLGKGEEATSGRSKLVNLSGAMEAVIAAVYLDQGLEAARYVILNLMSEEIERVTFASKETDYKSQLQELTQSRGQGTPVYRLTGETGPDHNKVFIVEVLVEGGVLTTGSGKSKKTAETEAAQKALEAIQKESE
jgi:ribonuclease-3